MDRNPAWHPDVVVYDTDDLPLSWEVRVRHNGQAMDLTALEVSAPVTNNGELVDELELDLSEGAEGIATLTLTQALFDQLPKLSTWVLRENSTYKLPLVRSRIVRAL